MLGTILRARECDGHVVVALRGELDSADAAEVTAALAAVAAREPQIVVDLSGLEFIDSAGVAALERARGHARRAGGDLLLAAPSDGWGGFWRSFACLTACGCATVPRRRPPGPGAACPQPCQRRGPARSHRRARLRRPWRACRRPCCPAASALRGIADGQGSPPAAKYAVADAADDPVKIIEDCWKRYLAAGRCCCRRRGPTMRATGGTLAFS